MKNYTELDVWKTARKLVKTVYSLTSQFPNTEIYTLTNQINRSVISIPSNIDRGKDFGPFLDMKLTLYLS